MIAVNETRAITVIAATERTQLFYLVDQERLFPTLEALYRERNDLKPIGELLAARAAGQPFYGYHGPADTLKAAQEAYDQVK